MPSLINSSRSDKKESNKDIVTMADVQKKADDANSFLSRLLGDVSKSSASKQIALGVSSGWITGLLAMKVGKTAALALGGGIILLQIASEKGYIKINWNKVGRQFDKVVDQVEENISGEGPSWMDKAERFLDRKVTQTEDKLKKQRSKAKRWYSRFSGKECKLKEVHIFFLSFVAGIAVGIGSG